MRRPVMMLIRWMALLVVVANVLGVGVFGASVLLDCRSERRARRTT